MRHRVEEEKAGKETGGEARRKCGGMEGGREETKKGETEMNTAEPRTETPG